MVKARPNTNGVDLDGLRERIQKAEDEIEQLRAVPVPRSDIEQCVKNYVANSATPQVRRIADGEPLQVTWPGDTIAALAFLLPEQMTAALLKEIDCLANSPMSLQARKRRVAELKAEIDTLQRQALALGEDASSLPPEVVLGVKIMRQPKINDAIAIEALLVQLAGAIYDFSELEITTTTASCSRSEPICYVR